MSRLDTPAYEEMSPEQQAVHDAIMAGPRGSVRGPFLAWLQTPAMADPAQRLGEYYRFNCSLSRDLAEIAIMVTAERYKAEFEWWAHSRMARDAGVDDAVIESIRTGADPGLDGKAGAVWRTARALNSRHRLTDAEFADARAVLGPDGLMDVVGLCGYYALVSLTLNTYEMETPDGSRAF